MVSFQQTFHLQAVTFAWVMIKTINPREATLLPVNSCFSSTLLAIRHREEGGEAKDRLFIIITIIIRACHAW